MKYLGAILLAAICVSCASTRDRLTPGMANKVKKVTVISLLGEDVSVTKDSWSTHLIGLGKYENDITPSWNISREVEAALGEQIQKSGREYLPNSISASERRKLAGDSPSVRSDRLFSMAAKTGADYLIVLSTNSLIPRKGMFQGTTNPVSLSCFPGDRVPRLLVMYKASIWNVKSRVQGASFPLTIDSRIGGEIDCNNLAKSHPKNIEKTFFPPFQLSAKTLASETVEQFGLMR